MLETIPCNICDSTEFEVVYVAGRAQQNQIVRCRNCGLMYANPRPAQAAHAALADRTSEELARDAASTFAVQRIEKEELQVRDYEGTRRHLNSLYPTRGSLLEIGSSYGFLLAAFEADGWDVVGVDPEDLACQYAKEKHDLKVISGTLQESNFKPDSFDVVIMNHVIEHVPDPVGMLEDIYRVLKPGGHLVMETPVYDTITHRLLAHRERSLSCDGHIYFFTTDSLERTFRLAGFEPVQRRRVGRSLTLNRLATNIGIVSKSKTIRDRLEATSRTLNLNRIPLSLNMHDMERVGRVPVGGVARW